jgi:XTP/dITP diphosphohydrolase
MGAKNVAADAAITVDGDFDGHFEILKAMGERQKTHFIASQHFSSNRAGGHAARDNSPVNKIVIASNNPGKLREFADLLAPFDFSAIPQSELGIREAEEPHATFLENALAKARHAARASGLPALADDSGLCVPALGGAPGVLSARYAGEPKSDARNNQKLIAELQGVADRRAFYYCSLVLMRHADDPMPLVAEADWQGSIVDEPQGDGGFGYNPHFFVPEHGLTAGQINDQQRYALSHRAKAMRLLAARLKSAPTL